MPSWGIKWRGNDRATTGERSGQGQARGWWKDGLVVACLLLVLVLVLVLILVILSRLVFPFFHHSVPLPPAISGPNGIVEQNVAKSMELAFELRQGLTFC